MKIFVIIVTYNAEKWIYSCFNSLKQSNIPLKTIVIDNASTDKTTSILNSYYPEIDLICSNVNLGFGVANNIGIKKAYQDEADFVFLLNQDAYVENDTIEKLCKIHSQNLDYGILSPIHYAENGNVVDEKFLNYITERKNNRMLSDIICNTKLNSIYTFSFINAAVWSISRKCIEEVGGFDPLFFHYGEDTDYCIRVNNKLLKIGVSPTIKAVHNRSQNKNNTSVLINKKEYILYLLRLKNSTHSLTFNYLKQFFKSFKLILSCLLRLKFNLIYSTLLLNLKSITDFNKIKISRKKSNKKMAFLN